MNDAKRDAIEARAKTIIWPQSQWRRDAVELIKTDIPALVADNRRLEAEVRRLRLRLPAGWRSG